MRRVILLLGAIAAALVCGTICRAQDAQKIISEYTKAMGGGKALSRVQTLTLSGNFSSSSNSGPGTFTLELKQPNRYYAELRTEGKTRIEAYNGKSAWHQIEGGEVSTLLGRQALEVEAAGLYYSTRLQGLSKHKIGADSKGRVPLRGRDMLELELTYPTGVQWEVYFDPQTHLIAGEKAVIAGIPQEMEYSDYRVVHGLKVPYSIRLHRGDETYAITVNSATVNERVGERVFDFPKKAQVQLPDLKKLFEEIDANQKQIDKVKENYAGSRVEEETEYDKNGKVTKKEAKEYTFFYLNGEEVSTLVKKDGRTLSEEEQKKENEKTQKEIEKLQKREEKREAKQEKAREEGNESKEKDEPGIEVFLRACQFVNPRRERFRGQDVLVFDFEPNPEYKPKNLEERFVKELAGVVWVDEAAHDVARLEAYFVNDMRLGGGILANLQKGTSFVFEQAYVNNEVWLPTYMEGHLGVRVLMLKGFKVNFAMHYSDYKRFNVETLSTIHKPKEAVEAPSKP